MSESQAKQSPTQPTPQASSAGPDHEAFTLLMSLSLDALLSPQEEADLTAHLGQCTTCAATWAMWQGVHERFVAAPAALPQAGFTARFELRRLQQSRRRRLWMGGLVAILSLTLWSSILVGGVLVGSYLLNNPIGALPQVVYDFTYFWAGLSAGLQGIWRGLAVAMTTSNLPWLLLGYGLLTLAALSAWTGYLRRSLRPIPATHSGR